MVFGLGGGVKFDSTQDIPDLSGKVALVTGGNGGIGAETVKQLAAHNCTSVYLAARTRKTAESTAASIKTTVPNANICLLDLDLGSFDSIKAAADIFNKDASRLDLFIANAGVAFNDPGMSASGYELQFGTNYMGHALLTKLLLPRMLETAKLEGADVRIVLVSSGAHSVFVPKGGIDFEAVKTDGKKYMTHQRYGMSKLGTNFMGKELARRYPSINTTIIHPGAVYTGIGRGFEVSHPWLTNMMKLPGRYLFSTPAEGARNQLFAASAKGVVSGEYYDPVGKAGGASKLSCDEAKGKEAWDWVERELAEKGYPGWP